MGIWGEKVKKGSYHLARKVLAATVQSSLLFPPADYPLVGATVWHRHYV